jgi:hypothetical protein
MLSREVEEAQQLLGVVGDLGHRPGPLDPVVARERLDGALGVVAVGGVADLRKGFAAPACTALGRHDSTLASLWTLCGYPHKWHKVRNVLAALPKSVHAGARRALNEILLAEDLGHARAAVEAFASDYGVKWPKAVAKVTDDAETLLTFFDYPAEHWVHLRTTNPIESSFAPVRARTRVTKGPGTRDMGLAMVFKLLQAAEGRWRAGQRPPPGRPGPRRREIQQGQADRTTRPDTRQGGRPGRHQGRRVIMRSLSIHRI